MSINARLLAQGSNSEFHSVLSPVKKEPTLVVMSPGQAHGVFRSANRTTAGTTAIVTPVVGNAILLTDLLISSQKFSSGSVEITFTDGTDSVSIFKIDVTDAPVFLSHRFEGYWNGWKDARIDFITVGDLDGTVSIGYLNIPSTETFGEWDNQR